MNTLESFRQEIDRLDAELVRVLGRRIDVCRQIARFKKERDIPMMQPGRVEAVKRRCMNMAMQYGINTQLIAEIYSLIIAETCRLEDAIIEANDQDVPTEGIRS